MLSLLLVVSDPPLRISRNPDEPAELAISNRWIVPTSLTMYAVPPLEMSALSPLPGGPAGFQLGPVAQSAGPVTFH